MELELKKERFDCYRAGAAMTVTREETAETIVPDYCPDIARIVETHACLLLRSRTATEGKIALTGLVKVTLLYMAEGAQGLRALEYTMPFEQSEKLPDGCEQAAVEGRVCQLETRLLNPRKLFTRLEIEWRITPFCSATLTTCGEIAEQERYAIQTLCEKYEVSLIRSVGNRDFVFADELTIPGGRDAIHELLCSRVRLRVTECKSIGSKVILKGVACVALLYAAQEGKLCSYAEELPFSQILDGVAQEEGSDMTASAVLNLSGCEIHTDGEDGDGRTVSIKLFLDAFLALRSMATVWCITDLYSTACELDAQTERVELWQEPKTTVVTQSVREQFDTGTDVQSVLDADVCFSGTAVLQEGGKAVLRTAATIALLYQDENGVPLSLERRVEITAETDADGAAQAAVEAVCAGDITASINAGGVELRFPVEFTVVSAGTPSCMCLTGLGIGETEENGSNTPALVLRALRADESLWDVAKQYRTTVEEILSANELTESAAIEAGQMLLIPRKR